MVFSDVIPRLELRSFRNYCRAEFTLAPGLNLLTGANGTGKTNVLEAIYYLAVLRSFRTRQIRDLVAWGAESFQIKADVRRPDFSAATLRLAAGFGREREISLNSAPVGKGSEFIHQFLCTAFIPEDIELARGPSAERRRFLDILSSQLDGAYLHDLHQFAQALKSRNAMLRQPQRFGRRETGVFETILVRHGAAVMMRRRRTIRILRQRVLEDAPAFHGEMPPRLELAYDPGVVKAVRPGEEEEEQTLAARYETALMESLEANRARDEQERLTTWGPQRDDLALFISGKPLAAFGSEGQCRTFALLLRLSSARLLLEAAAGRRGVVLLIDDVLGELDAARRAAFWRLLPRQAQLFFACTAPPAEIPADLAVTIHPVSP